MYAQIQRWLREATVYELREPKPGLRHQSLPRLVVHRFPIKNGLTFRQALVWSNGANPLLKLVLLAGPSIARPISEN
jgi:hypothetical protein